MKLKYCEQRLSSFGTASEAGPSGVVRAVGLLQCLMVSSAVREKTSVKKTSVGEKSTRAKTLCPMEGKDLLCVVKNLHDNPNFGDLLQP